jgi:hypothetical protein
MGESLTAIYVQKGFIILVSENKVFNVHLTFFLQQNSVSKMLLNLYAGKY